MSIYSVRRKEKQDEKRRKSGCVSAKPVEEKKVDESESSSETQKTDQVVGDNPADVVAVKKATFANSRAPIKHNPTIVSKKTGR